MTRLESIKDRIKCLVRINADDMLWMFDVMERSREIIAGFVRHGTCINGAGNKACGKCPWCKSNEIIKELRN